MKIFKKDTAGRIRYIDAYVEGDELVQVSGLIGTDSPVEHRKQCKGKNIGKKNETSHAEQALSELNSLIAEKTKKEYFYTQEEAENNVVILPMLAKEYKKYEGKIDWDGDIYVQRKYDGMRALGDKELISREGGIIDTCKHISDVLKDIPFHLDGELFTEATFQENMRLVKKYRKGETERIKFHVYDCVEEGIFKERYEKLLKFFIEKGNDFPMLKLVPTYRISNEKELKKYHSQFVSEGYEGTIIRHGKEKYKNNGRSAHLLKYKDFIDIALVIKDIEPGEQRPEWGVPVFEWKGAKNDELRAGMRYSHEERIDFLINKDKYIGQTGEVRFFEYSEDGVPRHPVMHGIRLDK